MESFGVNGEEDEGTFILDENTESQPLKLLEKREQRYKSRKAIADKHNEDDKLLLDAGIDVANLTKIERKEILQVLLLSRDEKETEKESNADPPSVCMRNQQESLSKVTSTSVKVEVEKLEPHSVTTDPHYAALYSDERMASDFKDTQSQKLGYDFLKGRRNLLDLQDPNSDLEETLAESQDSQNTVVSENNDNKFVRRIKESISMDGLKKKIMSAVDNIKDKVLGHGTVDVEQSEEDKKNSTELPLTNWNVAPLDRHYRACKATKKRKYCLFAPNAYQAQDYTKVILQLLNLYHHRVRRSQAGAKHRIPWNKDPIRVGKHMEGSLDMCSRRVAVKDVSNDDIQSDNESKNTTMKPKPQSDQQAAIELTQLSQEDVEDKEILFKDEAGHGELLVKDSEREVSNGDNSDSDFVPGKPSKGKGKKPRKAINRKKGTKDKDLAPCADDMFKGKTTQKRGKRKLHGDKEEKFLLSSQKSDCSHAEENKAIFPQSGEPVVKLPEMHATQTSSFPRMDSSDSVTSQNSSVSACTDIDKDSAASDSRSPQKSCKPVVYCESSNDSSSRGSSLMLDESGNIYCTQLCVIKSRMRMAKKRKMSQSNNPGQSSSNIHHYFKKAEENGSDEDVTVIKDSDSENDSETNEEKEGSKGYQIEGSTLVDEENVGESAGSQSPEFPSHKFHCQGGEGEPSTKRQRVTPRVYSAKKKSTEQSEIGDLSFKGKLNLPASSDVLLESQESASTLNVRRGRKRNKPWSRNKPEDEDRPKPVKQEMIQCPLCGNLFLQEDIEAHASACIGFSSDSSNDGVQVNNDSNEEKGSNEKKKEVTVPSTEMKTCILCDAQFPKGREFNEHSKHCVDQMTREQEERDIHGYRRREEPVGNRETRSRTLGARQPPDTEHIDRLGF